MLIKEQITTSNTAMIIFDQYSRYKACADLLHLAGFAKGTSILDVGSGPECQFGLFTADVKTTYVDPLIPIDSGPTCISGDVYSAELEDLSFDCVTAVDVLEHIPNEHRTAFLDRLSSLSTKIIILGFPTSDSSDALATDREISKQYSAIYGTNYSWLDEHQKFRLPSLADTEKYLKELGWHCQSVGHAHAPWLSKLLGLIVCLLDIENLKPVVMDISRKFNAELYRYDFNPPHYRQFVIATRSVLPAIIMHECKTIDDDAQNKFNALLEEACKNSISNLLRHVNELEQSVTKKHAELMKMSDWAYGMMQELSRRNQPLHIRFAKQVMDKKNVALKILADSMIGDIVRWGRAARRCRSNKDFINKLKQDISCCGGRLIITFPIIAWDFRRQRPQQILSRLRNKGYRVLYIAMSLTPHKRTFQNRNEAGSFLGFNELAPGIDQVWLHSSRPINIYTDSLEGDDLDNIVWGLEYLLQELKPDSIDYLIQFPGWWPVAKRLRDIFGGRVVFDCMDDHAGFTTNATQVIKIEQELIEKADLVIASSEILENSCQKINCNTIHVKNATEFDHFANPKKNGMLDHLADRPIIGYYGAISDWFDMTIVAYCATKRPDWHFILIGATTGADINPVVGMTNVHFLGEKPYNELPGYLAYFDVCIIPFKIIPLTQATNPVKFYEYLSAGKPVVSVALPELIAYKNVCYLAESQRGFLDQLEIALAERSDSKKIKQRLALACENSWDARVDCIMNALHNIRHEK